MLFKNLLVYRFTKPFTTSPEELDQKLAEKAFKPCGSQELASCGWVEPLGKHGSEMVHVANGRIMLCLQRQDKILPAAVVNEVLEEKVAEIQDRDDRKPGRKERRDLKDDIVFELLPKAFTRTSRQFAYIDPAAGLLVVNTGSHKRAEELLGYLRDALGSLPLIPLKAKNLIQPIMTQWLREGGVNDRFELGGECELRDSANEAAVIRCKQQDLTSKEINNHLQAGMIVTRLELHWIGGIDFILDDQLVIKRLRFNDIVKEKLAEVDTETVAEEFDTEFAIMAGEFGQFIPEMMAILGGEDCGDEGEQLQKAS